MPAQDQGTEIVCVLEKEPLGVLRGADTQGKNLEGHSDLFSPFPGPDTPSLSNLGF